VAIPAKRDLLALLEDAVTNSLRKGYHREGQDFSRLHASGVSKLLLKGESYAVPPNLKRLRLHERWRFDTPDHEVIFLDASCLAFTKDGRCTATVDYANTSAFEISNRGHRGGFQAGAIRHSGDEIDHERKTGEHTIDVELSALPAEITSLYFVVSAWTTALSDILQPSVHLHDADTGVELCAYELENFRVTARGKAMPANAPQRGAAAGEAEPTAGVMCRLSRSAVSSKWELIAIGSLGQGRASNYSPIIKDIKEIPL